MAPLPLCPPRPTTQWTSGGWCCGGVFVADNNLLLKISAFLRSPDVKMAESGPTPFQFSSLAVPPCILLRTVMGDPWRRGVHEMTGMEPVGDVIPSWVSDCVLSVRCGGTWALCVYAVVTCACNVWLCWLLCRIGSPARRLCTGAVLLHCSFIHLCCTAQVPAVQGPQVPISAGALCRIVTSDPHAAAAQRASSATHQQGIFECVLNDVNLEVLIHSLGVQSLCVLRLFSPFCPLKTTETPACSTPMQVVEYATSKLQENSNLQLAGAPLYVTSRYCRAGGGAQVQFPPAGQPALELLCNGMVRGWHHVVVDDPHVHHQAVPYDMSLAAVRQYIWKKSDDLVLHYRLLDVRAPAPLPDLAPRGD